MTLVRISAVCAARANIMHPVESLWPPSLSPTCRELPLSPGLKQMLTAAKANNSEEVAGKLHLGVTPLGVAFGLASGWIETCWSWLKVPPGLPQRTAHQLIWWLRWHRALPHHAERRIMRPPQHCLRLRRAPPSSTQVVLRRHAATGRV